MSGFARPKGRLHGASRHPDHLVGLARVVWPFVASAVLMGSVAAFCFYLMSAGRAYVDGESLWSKSQKDGLLYLERYISTCDPVYFRQYQVAMDVPFGDRIARLALERTPDQTSIIRRGFEQGRNHPDDIGGMIFIFKWLGWVPPIERAIQAWRGADEKLLEIHDTVQSLHLAMENQCFASAAYEPLIERIHQLNAELTPLQVAFSHNLGEANRMLFRLAVTAIVVGSLLLAGPGLWLSYRVVRSNLEALRRADEASRAKSEFLANMSHELRTPMNGVIGLIDVLQQTPLNDTQRETTELIRSSGATLLALIEDVLDLSRIEAGQMRVERIAMDSARVIEQVCGTLEPLAQSKQVALTLFTDPGIPPLVMGDPLRLRQVAMNLVGNAIKFSAGRAERGQVALRWTLCPGHQGEPGLLLSVADNGVGISEEARANLFKPFVQADLSTTRRYGGSGLGLAITHHLVSAMSGHIEVHSVPGKGSTFKVWLPLEQSGNGVPRPDSDPRLAHLQGLPCVVLCEPGSIVGDLASYLAHKGARIEAFARVDEAFAWRQATKGQGRRLWLLDEALQDSGQQLDALRLALRDDADQIVLTLGRGSNRRLRASQDRIGHTLDVNGLARSGWMQAVLSLVSPAAADANSNKVTTAAPALRSETASRGERVLVAEDNPANQKVIAFQLKSLGFTVDIASDGQQALQLATSQPYDIVITDLHMPNMDGYQFTAAVRQLDLRRHGGPRLPVIALTANAQGGEAERCSAQGLDDYLTKPVTLPLLSATLDKWLAATRIDEQEPA